MREKREAWAAAPQVEHCWGSHTLPRTCWSVAAVPPAAALPLLAAQRAALHELHVGVPQRCCWRPGRSALLLGDCSMAAGELDG